MRLPHKKRAKSLRRQLLRQLLLSICVVAPCSVMLTDSLVQAEDGATSNPAAKPESSLQPALGLPTFPSLNAGAPRSESAPKAASQPVLLPSPPPSSAGMVAESVTVKSATVKSAAAPAPALAAPAAATPALAPPTSSTTLPKLETTPIQGGESKSAAGSTVKVANTPVAIKIATTPPATAATKSGTDSVSIKFGTENKLPTVAAPSAADAHPVATKSTPTELTSLASPAMSFRLSDKAASSNVTPTAPGTLNVPSALNSSDVTGTSSSSATSLKLSDKQQTAAKVATPLSAVKEPSVKEIVAPIPQAMAPLTVSKEGVEPTVADKLVSQPAAVIFRPKATLINIPQPVTPPVPAMEKAAPLTTIAAQSPPSVSAKPSTSPAAETEKSVSAKKNEMKSVASKVSPLPPTAMIAAPINLVADVEPPKAINLNDKAPVEPTILAFETDDVVPPVVSDATAFSPSKPAVKKYSTPANRTIQVGTVSLTTMRVGEESVLKCEVDDTTVCRAIVTADGEVALLPGKVGITRATLWLKQSNGESKVETADIQVGELTPDLNSVAVVIEKLNENLQRLYPGTNLQAVAGDRCIEIRGEAEAEQQAREVLQLVRKLCLVPVKDKVTVR
jgi:hypothetical protein